MVYLFILGTVVFTVFGQLIIKWRINQYPALPEDMGDKFIFLFKLVLDPFILSGFVSAFIAALFWMVVMTKVDVSFAYPLITGGLTLVTVFMAVLLLGEQVTLTNMIGIALIVSGVIVMRQVS